MGVLIEKGCTRPDLLEHIRRIVASDLLEPLSRDQLKTATDAMWEAREWINTIQRSDIRGYVEVCEEDFDLVQVLLEKLIGAVSDARPLADRRATHRKDEAKVRLDEAVKAATGMHRDEEVSLLIEAASDLTRRLLDPSGFKDLGLPPWSSYPTEAHVQWRLRHGRTTKRKPATEIKAGTVRPRKRLKGS